MGQGGGSYVSGEQGWDRDVSRDGTGRGQLCELCERGAGMGSREGAAMGGGSGEQGWDREGAGMGQGGDSYVSGEQGWDREGAAM